MHAARENRKWIAPRENLAKINVDGGVARSGTREAVAAACRDGNGMYLGASAIVFEGLTDPSTLEAMACNEALALALNLI